MKNFKRPWEVESYSEQSYIVHTHWSSRTNDIIHKYTQLKIKSLSNYSTCRSYKIIVIVRCGYIKNLSSHLNKWGLLYVWWEGKVRAYKLGERTVLPHTCWVMWFSYISTAAATAKACGTLGKFTGDQPWDTCVRWHILLQNMVFKASWETVISISFLL